MKGRSHSLAIHITFIMLTLRLAKAFSLKSAPFLTRPTLSMTRCSMSTSTASIDAFIQSFDTEGAVGNNVEDAMYSLYNADAVCFDVDSTVIAEEGIDVLAEHLGKGSAVAELTKQAMQGDTKFQDALQMRLDLMKPSKSQIENCLKEKPLVITDGAEGLMQSLQAKNIDIWLVSGGFRIMIEPIASQLKIPISNIFANTILFDSEGNYQSFDPNEPTSRDMGKPKALEQIKAAKNYETMIMVGDGATDAQAKPPANAFIGFGGVIEREAVKQKADWFVMDFEDMTKIIEMR
jgi:phosphoserine phosphatase